MADRMPDMIATMPIWVYQLIIAFVAVLLLGGVAVTFERLHPRKQSLIGGIAVVLFLLYLAGGIGYALINVIINPAPVTDWDSPEPDCPGPPYTTAC